MLQTNRKKDRKEFQKHLQGLFTIANTIALSFLYLSQIFCCFYGEVYLFLVNIASLKITPRISSNWFLCTIGTFHSLFIKLSLVSLFLLFYGEFFRGFSKPCSSKNHFVPRISSTWFPCIIVSTPPAWASSSSSMSTWLLGLFQR